MQAYVTACKLMDLQASSWICMHSACILEHSACILEHSACIREHSACIMKHSGTFCMHSGTFWNILSAVRSRISTLLSDRRTEDIRTCWAASSQLKISTWQFQCFITFVVCSYFTRTQRKRGGHNVQTSIINWACLRGPTASATQSTTF